MKRFLILFILLPFCSCNDWLNVEPEDSVTFDNYFKNEDELEALYYSILSKMNSVTNGPQPYYWNSIDADEFSNGIKGFRELNVDTYFSKSSALLHTDWSVFYSVIYLANVFIDNEYRIENVSKERIEFWLQQAYFSKAMAYYRIAKIWGDAPIPKNSESTAPEGKKPALEVLQEAIRNAELALALPTHDKLRDSKGNSITSKQYASFGTVNTLLANIYAWMAHLSGEKAHWEKAEEYASVVIEGKAGFYDLEDMDGLVSNVFGKARNSKEAIYWIEHSLLDHDYYNIGNNFLDRMPGHYMLNYPYLTNDPGALAESQTGSYVRITTETVYKMYPEPEDLRLEYYWYNLGEVKYIKDGINRTSPYAYLHKWRDMIHQDNPAFPERPVVAVDCDYVIWRLADLILLRAECRARLDKTDLAKEDLDRIRKRAGLGKYSGSMDKEDLRKEIFLERRRELYGEGDYYFDIVRNGYYNDKEEKYLRGKFLTLTEQDVKNGALYCPVSGGAFGKNTLMTQNIYWQWQQ